MATENLLDPTVGNFLDLRYIGLSPAETILAMMEDHTADEMLLSMAADHLGPDALDSRGNPRADALTSSKAMALERISAMNLLLDSGQISADIIDEDFDAKALCAIRLIQKEEGLNGIART